MQLSSIIIGLIAWIIYEKKYEEIKTATQKNAHVRVFNNNMLHFFMVFMHFWLTYDI